MSSSNCLILPHEQPHYLVKKNKKNEEMKNAIKFSPSVLQDEGNMNSLDGKVVNIEVLN